MVGFKHVELGEVVEMSMVSVFGKIRKVHLSGTAKLLRRARLLRQNFF